MISIRSLFTILAIGFQVTVVELFVATDILEGYSVRMSADTSAILTEAFRNASEALQANTGAVPRLCSDRFIPKHF
jgi:hypothetical protein